jgi:hypothetical protein
MTPKKRLEGLEQACREQGVRLVYDEVQGEGGMCRLRDSYMIVINRRAAADTRVRIISDALERIGAARERRDRASLAAPVEEAVERLNAGVRAGSIADGPEPTIDFD